MIIKIEVPDGWLDESKLDDIAFITRTCRQEVQKLLIAQMTDTAMKDLKMPEIEIDRDEFKKVIMDKMAEKAIEQMKGGI